MTVAASENSADITGLLANVQYQFQVVAMAMLGGHTIRSDVPYIANISSEKNFAVFNYE